MKLTAYLFKLFIPVFAGAILFFALVLNLVDLLMNLWLYLQNEVPAAVILKVILLYIPKTVWYATPLAILFACSYTLSNLYARNELTAVFASGVSLFHFTFPLLVFSFLMSFAMFTFEDKLVVPTYSKKVEMQHTLFKQEKSLNNNNIVVLAESGGVIYKADLFDNSQQRLYNVYLIFRTEDKKLQSFVHADSAVWDENAKKWKLQSAVQYEYRDGTLVSGSVSSEYQNRLTEPVQTFRNNTVSVEEVNAREAKEYVNHLKRAGLPYGEELSLYYKKFAFPFILFIVVFLSIGLSGKTQKNVMLTSLAFSISAAVLFYVTQMVTMLLAKFGFITPFMGAWFPVFVFVILSVVLLRYART